MPLLNASIFVFQYFDDDTARKVSKYGVISGPYFSVFELNSEIYFVNTEKYGPEITPYLDTSKSPYSV